MYCFIFRYFVFPPCLFPPSKCNFFTIIFCIRTLERHTQKKRKKQNLRTSTLNNLNKSSSFLFKKKKTLLICPILLLYFYFSIFWLHCFSYYLKYHKYQRNTYGKNKTVTKQRSKELIRTDYTTTAA